MFPLLIALVVFLLAGIAITALLRKRPSQSGDLKQGLTHLAGLRWRDFAKLVLQAMQARGYDIVREEGSPADGLPTDGGDILLRQGSQLTLLSCRYGNAAVIGAQVVLGAGNAAELRGASSAIMVTPGRFDEEAKRVARQQHVELIDGATLWPEVKPFLKHELPTQAHAQSGTRDTAIAWGGAAVIAAVTWMLAQGMQDVPPTTDTMVPAASAAPVEKSSSPATRPPPAVEHVPTDPAALERRRNETANAISTLTGVDRAVWSTQSTLLVYLSTDATDPSGELCPLLERYPELAASRVQLQPPPDSEKPVRFKQCRSY